MRAAPLILLLLLAGCGGNGGAAPDEPNAAPVPAGAAQYCREHPEDELCR